MKAVVSRSHDRKTGRGAGKKMTIKFCELATKSPIIGT